MSLVLCDRCLLEDSLTITEPQWAARLDRAIWEIHQARQVLEAHDRAAAANALSELIRKIEAAKEWLELLLKRPR